MRGLTKKKNRAPQGNSHVWGLNKYERFVWDLLRASPTLLGNYVISKYLMQKLCFYLQLKLGNLDVKGGTGFLLGFLVGFLVGRCEFPLHFL